MRKGPGGLPRPPKRKVVDKHKTMMMNRDLNGLKVDYSKQVQAIIDQKKQKMFNTNLLNQIRSMKSKVDKQFLPIAHLYRTTEASRL